MPACRLTLVASTGSLFANNRPVSASTEALSASNQSVHLFHEALHENNETLYAFNEMLHANNVSVNACIVRRYASDVIVNAYNETCFADRGTAEPFSRPGNTSREAVDPGAIQIMFDEDLLAELNQTAEAREKGDPRRSASMNAPLVGAGAVCRACSTAWG